ncbi:disease resistance protein RUN1-like [Vicia villosa]|uniref:disease resistance protein RUN1-like n=1 Tax=Vicia villosa TaxID=3911 RepID=UPI00273A87FA|nr:disease resistance protein RUN1-like [Vicia villosa]
MPSSSSSSAPQFVYDVFLNFRGKDVRRSFVSQLYKSLTDAGIHTFLDDESLEKGTDLEPELMRAIEASRICIVVFTRAYITSTWCLKELVHIMNCCKTTGQIVLPIFYHVEASEVRHQNDGYRRALQATAKRRSSGGERMEHMLSKWTTALNEAGTIIGWDFQNFRNEVELISEIVQDVSRKLKSRLLKITEFPVGLDTRVQQMIHFIEKHSTEVCLIGIWGMAGSGKTTTARAIYNSFNHKFLKHCFIGDIRQVCERGDGEINHLQEQLLSSVSKTNEKIHNTPDGIATIEKRFIGKKALVVLDDVSTFEQVEALCGNSKCFGSGTVLIVTSRDLRILKLLEVDRIYSIKEMDESKSLELFCWHVFRKPNPKDEFVELSKSIVAYCGGLPLALEVIGSYLRGRPEQFWEYVLSQLERIPNDKVQDKLQISYEGLEDDLQKDIFLDICCFFIGKDRAHVSEILDGCGPYSDVGITVLIERSLLKVEKNNKLGMHGLLRDMGREIVRKESKKEPEKRSRLWLHKDAHKVLTDNSGTKTVEGLVMNSQSTNKNGGTKTVEGLVMNSQSTNNVCFETDTFKEMKNLRLLQLHDVDLIGDFKHLSQELRWLHWQGFTGECIPGDFNLGNLVAFELKRSNIKQVWNETKLMEKLKILNLSHSMYLTSTPDFSKLPNLEKLIMKDCPSLSVVHQSIGDLRNILLINFKDCTSLSNLPETINQLKSLKTLILSGCSKIDKLEESIVQMESLTTLVIKDTGVKEEMYSVVRSKSIGYISLCGYEGLSFDVFPSVIWSWMSPTMALSLASINVQNNNSGFLTPIVRSLSQLRTVWIQCHSKVQLAQELQRILVDQHDINRTDLEDSLVSNLSLKSHLIGMGSCHTVMDTLCKRIPQGSTTNDSSNFFLPGGNYPSWLAYTNDGPSAPFHIPKDINCLMEGIVLRVVYSSTSETMAVECLTSVLIINNTKCTIHIYKRDTVVSFIDEDWKNVISNLEPGDDVEIYVVFGHGLIVKKTTVCLIYGQSVIMEVDSSIKMELNVLPQPLPEVNMQTSSNGTVPKANKSLFSGFGKKMGACLCLNQQRDKDLNNF